MTADELDQLDRLEQAIRARLLADDDVPQIAKDLGCPPPLVQSIYALPDF